MTRLTWADRPREIEYGVDRGVYYPLVGDGEAWNGLVSVDENPADDDNRAVYVDGRKVHNRRAPGSFAGTINAFTYPDAFDETNRKPFGMSYRVRVGNHEKIHLVYNILAAPSAMSRRFQEANPFSWNFTTTPVLMPDGRATAHLIIDTSIAYPSTVAAFEDLIYGDDAEGLPTLPLPGEVNQIFEDNALFQVVHLGDGIWSISGPGDSVSLVGDNIWELTWPSVVEVDTNLYNIYSF